MYTHIGVDTEFWRKSFQLLGSGTQYPLVPAPAEAHNGLIGPAVLAPRPYFMDAVCGPLQSTTTALWDRFFSALARGLRSHPPLAEIAGRRLSSRPRAESVRGTALRLDSETCGVRPFLEGPRGSL